MSAVRPQLESLALRCSALGDRQNEVLHRLIGGFQAAPEERVFTMPEVVGCIGDAVERTEAVPAGKEVLAS